MDALKLAQTYAKSQGTAVLDWKANDDGTITVILVSGPKLRLTPTEMQAAIDEKDTQLKIVAAELDARNEVLAQKSKPSKAGTLDDKAVSHSKPKPERKE